METPQQEKNPAYAPFFCWRIAEKIGKYKQSRKLHNNPPEPVWNSHSPILLGMPSVGHRCFQKDGKEDQGESNPDKNK